MDIHRKIEVTDIDWIIDRYAIDDQYSNKGGKIAGKDFPPPYRQKSIIL